MATTYAAGDQTKEKIIKETKKLLYKHGLTNTTYDQISSMAKINRALIPYHFKSKQSLAQVIYSNIMNDFLSRFDAILDIEEYSPDFISILRSVAYYKLLENRHFARFVYELQADTSFSAFMEETEKTLMEGLIFKASKLSQSEADIILTSEMGMKKELVRLIATTDVDIDNIAKIQMYMLLGYAGYSKKKIEELYDSASQVIDMLSFKITSGMNVEIAFK